MCFCQTLAANVQLERRLEPDQAATACDYRNISKLQDGSAELPSTSHDYAVTPSLQAECLYDSE